MELFLEQGYENTTVQQITEKADVAKGTFFSHFPTKDAILAYLGEQRIELMREHIANELMRLNSAAEQITKLFDLLGDASEADKNVTRLISYEVVKKLASPEIAEETENHIELKMIIEQILKFGQKNGEFNKDIQPSHVADILIGIYFYTLFQWLAADETKSLKNEYRIRMSIVLKGIAVGDS